MNIVEQSFGEWLPKKVVTEDQLIVMCKQEKDELIEQAMLDAILNRESWHKKFKEQGWML